MCWIVFEFPKLGEYVELEMVRSAQNFKVFVKESRIRKCKCQSLEGVNKQSPRRKQLVHKT